MKASFATLLDEVGFTGIADYFNSLQIVTPPVIINQRKMTTPSHNKLENCKPAQVIMTPLIGITNQWRVNINW